MKNQLYKGKNFRRVSVNEYAVALESKINLEDENELAKLRRTVIMRFGNSTEVVNYFINKNILIRDSLDGNHIKYRDADTALKYPEVSILVTSMKKLFSEFYNLSANFSNFNTSNVEDMSSMF